MEKICGRVGKLLADTRVRHGVDSLRRPEAHWLLEWSGEAMQICRFCIRALMDIKAKLSKNHSKVYVNGMLGVVLDRVIQPRHGVELI